MFVYIRAILFAFGLLVIVGNALSQVPNPAALQARLLNSRPDTSRLSTLLKLADYYNNLADPSHEINRAMTYGTDAEKLSLTLNDKRGLANSYTAQAKTWRNKRDTAKAMDYLRRAKNLFVANRLLREAAEVVLNMEEFYQYFGGTDINVRIAYYQQALALFQKTTAKNREEATLKVLGDFYYVAGDNLKSLQYLQQAQALIEYAGVFDKEGLYDLLGSVNAQLGNLNKALEYGLLAVKMTELGKDTTMQACAVYNRVGITYYNMKELKPALLYFQKSLNVATRCKDIQTQINEYVLIAQVMTAQGRFADCADMLKKVSKQFPAAEITRHIGFDLCFLRCYVSLKKFTEAKVYCDRIETAIKKDKQNNSFMLAIQNYLVEYYIATHQDRPARAHLSLMRKAVAAQHNTLALALTYSWQAALDSIENNLASAYKNLKIANSLQDSIWNEREGRQVAQLQIQFETEKKDQQLKAKADRVQLLNNQARLQKINLAQEKTTQKLIAGGVLLLLILLALTYNSYRSKQRVNRQLQVQQLEIEQKNQSLTNLVHQKDDLLQEKEWLMKEIHHRVKNNLQIVISLLSSQSNYLDNDVAYKAIRESQHRMQSISLIHQKLYQSENLALVDIRAYITDLIAYLRESFDTGPRITFETDIAHAKLDVTRAVPLGLILNEAITNAIKYAFPGNRNGKISITLKPREEGVCTLIIHDDGVGLPETIDFAKSKSLGMSLMRGLSKQLGGSLRVESGKGITIIVDFVDEKLLKAV
ncbi:hypothetical protein BEL04_11530 [Mucilaginibacter sp. PPCGB 2223]|uniref:tetratricopeptide repeat-containing sensor histidine kinase n=1 Tax=Mucilaginibacter sp. PPCGB 2223 TaxID=1886027 RepID=UPI0008243390|nr:histidine kinase dimerization/phosphoacceptor domain -containing protein [Mucilaginibacter sp. PPCGB 2223]OCX52119.1 hypothetical protein BEL04_11530 [Mucilaginibacter sp. PPCGB 2223]